MLCVCLDTRVAGGDQYATLTSLAYRQTTGANAVVWNPSRNLIWMFMKEISSDGDVRLSHFCRSDEIDNVMTDFNGGRGVSCQVCRRRNRPSILTSRSPLFTYMAPETLRLILLPLLAYANNETNIPYNLAWLRHCICPAMCIDKWLVGHPITWATGL